MENPLLFLKSGNTALGNTNALKELCAVAHPVDVAEFLEPLSPDEICCFALRTIVR